MTQGRRAGAYRTSIPLERAEGSFPFFDRDPYPPGRVRAGPVPRDIREDIARDGTRNSHLTAIAPAETISLLADDVSSGAEPVFALRYGRTVLTEDGAAATFELSDGAWRLWRELRGSSERERPAPPHPGTRGRLNPNSPGTPACVRPLAVVFSSGPVGGGQASGSGTANASGGAKGPRPPGPQAVPRPEDSW